MNTIKTIIYSLFIIFIVQSCSMVYLIATFDYGFVYYYEKKFQNFEKKAKFKKEDAWKIYTAYCKQKQIHQDTFRTRFLYGRFNNNYVFKNRLLYHGKTVYFYGSVYVNTKTGKARYVRKTWRNVPSRYCRVWQGDELGTFIEMRDLK